MRRSFLMTPGHLLRAAACLAFVLALTGCGTLARASRPLSGDIAGALLAAAPAPRDAAPAPGADHTSVLRSPAEAADLATEAAGPVDPSSLAAVVTGAAPPDTVGVVAVGDDGPQPLASDAQDGAQVLVAQAKGAGQDKEPYDEYDIVDYDPWERFNEKMFAFNLKLDRYVLKPVAKFYDKILPDRIQIMIANAIDNAGFVPRVMNSLFQGKWDGAMRELGRFMLNTTVGVGGFFDIAKHEGIEKSREDFGQTLGYYGAEPGPYVVVPFLDPFTVRDGLGRLVDMFLDPVGYLLPLIWERLVMRVTGTVNDRSLNLELFQGFEDTTIDLYSAVRHAYLQRRQQLIKE